MKVCLKSSVLALSLFALPALATNLSTVTATETLNLVDLAKTYSDKKVSEVTRGKSTSKEDALFIDMGVINISDLGNDKLLSKKLDLFIKDYTDTSENYIGNVSDKFIIERMVKVWDDTTAVTDEGILSIFNKFIDEGYTTGYNLIDIETDSNFDEALTIRYGHSDIDHAKQLVLLMKSEGFDPKLQLATKSSAFLYLPEWGPASYPVHKLPSGKQIAVVKEYNLDFQFNDENEKNRFMDLINTYAKKDSKDEAGLIYKSWWQPFYRSYIEEEGYKHLVENQVFVKGYRAELMSLPENAKKQEEQMTKNAQGYKVKSIDVWVNPSFYRYMNGEFK